MNLQEQFNLIANEYDMNRRIFIPCFDDYYIKTTEFITNGMNTPKRILDLGAGTGLLSLYWYKCFPTAEYVLTDIANEMLDVGRKRFDGLKNISFEICDYTKGLPKEDFDVIISALSIHHLENDEKQKLFKRIYDKLPQGSLFVNYDQFCGNTPLMTEKMDGFWVDLLEKSSLSQSDLERWQSRRLLDKECSFETEIEMLRNSGFSDVSCVYSSQKFSVITAIK